MIVVTTLFNIAEGQVGRVRRMFECALSLGLAGIVCATTLGFAGEAATESAASEENQQTSGAKTNVQGPAISSPREVLQMLGTTIERRALKHQSRGRIMRRRHDISHDPAGALENVDRRKVISGREFTR